MKCEPFISFRLALPEDSRIVFDWRNDFETRRNSISSQPLIWQDHDDWFQRRIFDPQVAFYILLGQDLKPVGQIRVDLDGGGGLISITVAPEARGQGYGVVGLKMVIDHFVREKKVSKLKALVNRENIASQKIFFRNSFVNKGERLLGGRCFMEFELSLHKGE